MDKVLKAGVDNVLVGQDLFDTFHHFMNTRLLRDRNTTVRIMAFQMAASNVTDATNEEFLRAINYDPCKDIRRFLTQRIVVNQEALEGISINLRDKEEVVRQAAFERLADVPFANLEVPMR
jgi:hypothetical protein